MRFILFCIFLIVPFHSLKAKELKIWFVANVGVGIEQFIGENDRGKYWKNRVHWVELKDTLSSQTFKSKDECEMHLLKKYSNIWRSNGGKTLVVQRDPNYVQDAHSSMTFADEPGFMTTPLKDWSGTLTRFVPFYTCAMQRVILSDLD